MTPRLNWLWASAAIILFVTTVAGITVAWSRYSRSVAVEVTFAQPSENDGLVSIGGAVAAPGVYPFKSSDSIEALVQAAGGLTDNASLNDVSLVVVRHDTDGVKQRVNINRADAWLLQALPGVGDTLANRIVDYREQNGDFANTSELVRVSGIGESLFERIKDLVTVSE